MNIAWVGTDSGADVQPRFGLALTPIILEIQIMRSRFLLGLMTAALLSVPTAASAVPVLLTVSIQGVSLTPPDTSLPIPLQPTVYAGLANCVNVVGAPNECIPGGDPVGINNVAIGEWRDWGFGLALDQVILAATSFGINVEPGSGPITPPPQALQSFWFVVGSTGGGSAGPLLPGDCPESNGGVTSIINLPRQVTISDGTVTLTSQTINQQALLSVGWCFDALTVLQSAPVVFNLGPFSGFTNSDTLTVTLMGHLPVYEGDPDILVGLEMGTAAVPLPSTFALLGLGLAGFAGRRRQAARSVAPM